MSNLLNIGRSGLRAFARSMETVSHNIANAENPDYVRRSVEMSDATVSGSLNPAYLSQTGLNGVRIAQTVRASDEFVEAQVRQTGAARIRAETQLSWLERLETNLDNAGSNVGTRLNTFFGRAEEVAAAPFDNSLKLTLLTELDAVVDAFRRTSSNMTLTAQQVTQGATQEANTLNAALENLNKINLDITRTKEGTDAHAGLLDARDAMLATITEKLNATISLAPNGTATISYGGQQLAGVNFFANVTASSNADGSLALQVDGTAVAVPSEGSLAGLSRAGATAQGRLNDLNALAQQLVTDINAWQAQGRTLSGAVGAPLLTMPGDISTLEVTTRDTAQLALAAADGTPNGNLLTLPALRTTDGVETKWNNFMAGFATNLSAVRSESEAATALDEGARRRRDAMSGVDLDREAADLIRLQQAYEASARVIQVARDTMQTILNVF
ncbi:flagellar hook-associated protein FlgK [Blastomonas sp. SL216]|uniref:flagellar hook-associated protein FlgK n=1 Tax=Blastomonas sp. SL216 TaxID=2995169 RepID=UPI002377674C|nr:flagellar hook-associated protein FlgK [Blastomonas sp. SL216]